MMKANWRGSALWQRIYWVAAFGLLLGLAGSPGLAQSGETPAAGEPLATIAYTDGAVGVWTDGGTEWAMVSAPHELHLGDHVRTGDDARAIIVFSDESEVLMHE